MKYVKSYCFFYKIWQKSMLKNSMLLVIGFCDSAVKRNTTWSKVVRRQLKIFLIWIKLDQENSKLNMYIVYVIWFLAAVNFRNRNRTIIRLSNRRPIDLQNVENYYCQSVEFIAIHEQILQKVRGANSWWKIDFS